MIDLEKVIKAVECRKNVHKRCGNPCERIGDCEYAVWARDSDSEPYYPCCCDIERLCDDILFLLKEQEAEQPIVHENSYGWKFYYCPKCKQEFYQNRKQAYCDKCGQAVKWE